MYSKPRSADKISTKYGMHYILYTLHSRPRAARRKYLLYTTYILLYNPSPAQRRENFHIIDIIGVHHTNRFKSDHARFSAQRICTACNIVVSCNILFLSSLFSFSLFSFFSFFLPFPFIIFLFFRADALRTN